MDTHLIDTTVLVALGLLFASVLLSLFSLAVAFMTLRKVSEAYGRCLRDVAQTSVFRSGSSTASRVSVVDGEPARGEATVRSLVNDLRRHGVQRPGATVKAGGSV